MKRFLATIILAGLYFCAPALAQLYVLGDSFGLGNVASPTSLGFAQQTANLATGGSIVNYSLSGAMVPDQAGSLSPLGQSNLYAVPPTGGARLIELGVDDERIYCPPSSCTTADPAKIALYQLGIEEAIAWLGMPMKVVARGGACETGVWADTPVNPIGRSSNTFASTKCFTITGRWVVLSMLGQDSATGEADVGIDGALVDHVKTLSNGIGPTSGRGINFGPQLHIYDTGADTAHTLTLTVTSPSGGANYVYAGWAAGSDQPSHPQVIINNIPRAASYPTGGSDQNVAAFNSALATATANVTSFGINAILVNIEAQMNTTTDIGDGAYHPGNLGHGTMAVLDAAAMLGLHYP